MAELRLTHDGGRSLRIAFGDKELLRYVYQPWDVQLESPRPFFHPVRTLAGNVVTLYRPHDHVWHKGIALSLPNVGPANFWGGVTFVRDGGYRQLPNNGAMVHREFELITPEAVTHRLDWITEQGEKWFTERRGFTVSVDEAVNVWTLGFTTSLTNTSGHEIAIGSPTTEGRPNAGYGGLFWRGPRSFTGGTVFAPGVTGGDELMGIRAPWLGFSGKHDEEGGASTLVFIDRQDSPQWFVRSEPFACVCPAPFFSEEVPIGPGETLSYDYAIVIADSAMDLDEVTRLAAG
jgi:hypothetical protein